MAKEVKKEGAEKAPSKKIKVKALIHLNKFGLAWSVDQEFEIEEAKANELIELKAVEVVK